MHFYLYLFVDIFSRKIVGWQVFDRESAELAAGLLRDICERQGIPEGQLTVHSDNGSLMKGETMLATMQRLGVAHSRSRPSVSNDNPYSESLFRTLKYRPQLPLKPFADILEARRWVTDLVNWYNHEHRHSAIRFVTGLGFLIEQNALLGVYDPANGFQVPLAFEGIKPFENKYILVSLAGKDGLLDLKGKEVLAPSYQRISRFDSQTLVLVQDQKLLYFSENSRQFITRRP